MARLANPRHEAFAQYLHQGYECVDAYERAGFRRHRQNASRMMARDDIQRRVAELQERAAIQNDVTVDELDRELQEAQKLAHATNQPAAIVSAVQARMKLHGMDVQKHQVDSTTRVVSAEPMDEETWAAEYGAESEALH